MHGPGSGYELQSSKMYSENNENSEIVRIIYYVQRNYGAVCIGLGCNSKLYKTQPNIQTLLIRFLLSRRRFVVIKTVMQLNGKTK